MQMHVSCERIGCSNVRILDVKFLERTYLCVRGFEIHEEAY
jgi:hypothetical protein